MEAAHYATKTCPGLDKKVIEAMVELEPEVAGIGARTVQIWELGDGMVIDQDVRSSTGLLVAAKGQDVTPLLLLKLKSFVGQGRHRRHGGGVRAQIPTPVAD